MSSACTRSETTCNGHDSQGVAAHGGQDNGPSLNQPPEVQRCPTTTGELQGRSGRPRGGGIDERRKMAGGALGLTLGGGSVAAARGYPSKSLFGALDTSPCTSPSSGFARPRSPKGIRRPLRKIEGWTSQRARLWLRQQVSRRSCPRRARQGQCPVYTKGLRCSSCKRSSGVENSLDGDTRRIRGSFLGLRPGAIPPEIERPAPSSANRRK
jgi:hypothetical protein